jgi:hypothetical protein
MLNIGTLLPGNRRTFFHINNSTTHTSEMSSEKYERPDGFPLWVDSEEDEGLVVDAIALDATNIVFSSKKNCERFINTKRSFSAGKY